MKGKQKCRRNSLGDIGVHRTMSREEGAEIQLYRYYKIFSHTPSEVGQNPRIVLDDGLQDEKKRSPRIENVLKKSDEVSCILISIFVWVFA